MNDLDQRLARLLDDALPQPTRGLDAAAIRDAAGQRRRATRRLAPALAAAAVAVVAAGSVLVARSGRHDTPPSTDGLSAHDRTFALAAAHREADRVATKGNETDQSGWPTNIDTVTAVVHDGTVNDPNTGHPCSSGQIIAVTLIGAFAIPVSGPAVPAGSSDMPDRTVHGVDLLVDEQTGDTCLLSVRTGAVEPRTDSTVLYQR